MSHRLRRSHSILNLTLRKVLSLQNSARSFHVAMRKVCGRKTPGTGLRGLGSRLLKLLSIHFVNGTLDRVKKLRLDSVLTDVDSSTVIRPVPELTILRAWRERFDTHDVFPIRSVPCPSLYCQTHLVSKLRHHHNELFGIQSAYKARRNC